MRASAPCSVDSGWYGCSAANAGMRAAHSLIFGLYFIVHEPSGYRPMSMA